MRRNCFFVFIAAMLIIFCAGCSKHHNVPEPLVVVPPPLDTVPPVEVDSVRNIFMAGVEYDRQTQKGYATFWHNGQAKRLTGGVASYAYAITVNGSDVYIAGAIELQNGDARAVIWKNEVLIPLVDTTDTKGELNKPSVAQDMIIYDHKVYVVGMMTTGDFEQYAALWVDGKPEKLEEGIEGGSAQAIGFTTNGDMYILGATIQDHYVIPSLWKNKVRSTLDYAITASDMAIKGEDVYVVCNYINESFYGLPCVVKNDALFANLTDFTTSNKLAVSDSGVYVAGQSYVDWSAMCWQNGKSIHLPGFNANDIAVNGEDVYVVGNSMNGAFQYGKLWKNGLEQPLSDSLINSDITSISLSR